MTTAEAHGEGRRRQRDDPRAAILDAADTLLAEQGAGSLSMRRLAEASGYTVPTLYHHFGDKLGLVEAVLDRAFGELVDELEALPRGDDPIDFVRAGSRVFVAFGQRMPAHYGLLLAPVSGQPPKPASLDRARDLLHGALSDLACTGRLADPDPRRAAQMIWVLCHGLIWLPGQRPDLEWADDLRDAAIDRLLDGLLNEEGDAR